MSERAIKLAEPRHYKKKTEKNWQAYLENRNFVSKNPLKTIHTSRLTELAKPLHRKTIKAERDITRLSVNKMALKAVASPRIIELSKPKSRNFNKTKPYQKDLASKITISEEKTEINTTKHSKQEKGIDKYRKLTGNNELKCMNSRKEIVTDKIKPIEITDLSTKELIDKTDKEQFKITVNTSRFEKCKNKSEKFLKTEKLHEKNKIRKLYLKKIETPHLTDLKERKQDLKSNIKANIGNLQTDISNKNKAMNGSKDRSSKSLKEGYRKFSIEI